MGKRTVFIGKARSYNKESISKVLEEGLEALKLDSGFFKTDKPVLLKPNLLSDSAPEENITTHPLVVEAVGDLLKKYNCEIAIGDSSGGSLVNIEKIWKTTEMTTVSRKLDCELINFSRYGIEKVKPVKHRYFPEYPLSEVYKEFSYIVNIPKLKTHSMLGFTGALKNFYGLIPGFSKVTCHKIAPKAVSFAEIIVHLYTKICPRLTVVDSIVAMEGHGPAAGDPNNVGLIIMGLDPLVVDVVLAKLIGINVKKDPLFLALRSFDIEVPDFDQIQILGEKFQEVKPQNFALCSATALSNLLPEFLTQLISKLLWIYPYPSKERCTTCGLCRKICPAEAISLKNKVAVIDRSKCIGCFCCTELCPEKAIDFDHSWLAKRFIKTEEK